MSLIFLTKQRNMWHSCDRNNYTDVGPQDQFPVFTKTTCPKFLQVWCWGWFGHQRVGGPLQRTDRGFLELQYIYFRISPDQLRDFHFAVTSLTLFKRGEFIDLRSFNCRPNDVWFDLPNRSDQFWSYAKLFEWEIVTDIKLMEFILSK